MWHKSSLDLGKRNPSLHTNRMDLEDSLSGCLPTWRKPGPIFSGKMQRHAQVLIPVSLRRSLQHFSENDVSVKGSGKRQFRRNGKVGAWRAESRSSTKMEARLGWWRLGAGMESRLHLTWLNCSIQTPACVLLSSRGSPPVWNGLCCSPHTVLSKQTNSLVGGSPRGLKNPSRPHGPSASCQPRPELLFWNRSLRAPLFLRNPRRFPFTSWIS